MTMYHSKLAEIVRKDPRFAYEAYEFLFAALAFTQKQLGRVPAEETEAKEENHVSGAELVQGACNLAKHEFGLMARTVFKQWGINKTGDFGEIVFNLIEAQLMSKTDDDCREDFADVLDLDAALAEGNKIELDDNA